MDYAELLPVIDVADALKRVMNNKKIYAKLLGSFKGRQMADDVISAIDAGDFSKIAEAAHTLKGVAANLSMEDLRQVIFDIEQAAKAGESPARFVGDLNARVDAVYEAIGRLVENGEMK